MGCCFSKNKYQDYLLINPNKYSKEHQISIEMMSTYYK